MASSPTDSDGTLVVLDPSPAKKAKKRTVLHALVKAALKGCDTIKKVDKERLEASQSAERKAAYNRKATLRQLIPVFEVAAAKGDQAAAIELKKYMAEDAALGDVKRTKGRSLSRHEKKLVEIHSCGPLVKALAQIIQSVDSFISSRDASVHSLEEVKLNVHHLGNVVLSDLAVYKMDRSPRYDEDE